MHPNGLRLARVARTRSRFHVAFDELTTLNRELSELIALLDRDLVLARTVRLLTEGFGFHCAWIAERTSADGVQIGHTAGNRTDRFHGVMLRNGCGLGGKVFADGRLAWVNDYLGSPEITHDYDREVSAEQIRCMIAAPIGTAPHRFGVLLAGLRDDRGFGDRAATIVQTVAERTAQAIVASERARRSIEAAVSEERERLASELYDSVGSLLCGEAAQRLRDVVRRMRSTPVRRHDTRRRLPRPAIARREHDVLRRVARGETNGQIALGMSLSLNTVKTYLRNAMQKLGARNRVEAIARAREAGLL